MRTRAERRHNDLRKAKRKWRMDLDTAWECHDPRVTIQTKTPWLLHGGQYWLYYDNLHQYSKNKIHCACPMCSRSRKTKNKGRHKGWAPSYNPTMRDKRRDLHMSDEEQNYFQDDCN